MLNYFRTLKYDLSVAFDIPEILQKLEDFITVLDKPTDDDAKEKLPRYKKLKRLESFYDTLIKISLTVLHNFYWKDITKGVDGEGRPTKNISYRIQQVLPIMMRLKNEFEDQIEHEFPGDEYERQFFKGIRNK
jgi:hypothetical protein